MKEYTYCFEDYEIFVVTVNGKVTEVYTYADELTVGDVDNPLLDYTWKKSPKNSIFVTANNPEYVYRNLSKFFTKL